MGERTLTETEIAALKARGCDARDWGRVRVTGSGALAVEHICRVRFAGDIRLGDLSGEVADADGVRVTCGVYDAELMDCTVGDGSRISRVGRRIVNYDIASGVVIENIDSLVVCGTTAFGCGETADVVVEAGGRPVTFYDGLSAQIAYMVCFYREDASLQDAIAKMIAAEVKRVMSARGMVGSGAVVSGCGMLKNVRIGAGARVTGAAKLDNVSLLSQPDDPVVVGAGVELSAAVLCPGARVESGAVLHHCFVGEGAWIGKHFSAENSLFFANAEAYNGEACAAFLGPFAVSHHRGTLLLTALYSFYNAGSGSNFSNHRYKLGPIHQGVMERGCKTASNSYVCWPARVGAFTTVLGRHAGFVDTGAFPFSYLMEEEGQSQLVPAANLFTVGTVRDAAKWMKRDRRKFPAPRDLLHPQALSPYTLGRIVRAVEEIDRLESESPLSGSFYPYAGTVIPASRLAPAKAAYETALTLALGEAVVDACESAPDLSSVIQVLEEAERDGGDASWIDVCGLLLPSAAMQALRKKITSGVITSADGLQDALRREHAAYEERARRWLLTAWLRKVGKRSSRIASSDLLDAVRAWREAVKVRADKLLADAAKEFSAAAKISFGMDGESAVQPVSAALSVAEEDFAAVRGTFDDNAFVRQVREDAAIAERRAEDVLAAWADK